MAAVETDLQNDPANQLAERHRRPENEWLVVGNGPGANRDRHCPLTQEIGPKELIHSLLSLIKPPIKRVPPFGENRERQREEKHPKPIVKPGDSVGLFKHHSAKHHRCERKR